VQSISTLHTFKPLSQHAFFAGMAKPHDTTPKSSRFLQLPPELRNRTYGLCTDGYSYGGVSLFGAQSEAPSYAITAVSHQVRNESLGIYQDARRKFWSDNTFRIHLSVDEVFYSHAQQEVTARCLPMPSLGIERLRFVVGPSEKCDGPDSLMVEDMLKRSERCVRWRKWFAGELVMDVSERFAEIASANNDRVHQYGAYPRAIGGLIVASCAKSFFEWALASDTAADIERLWL